MEQAKMKLVIVTGMYKRPEIFDFFAKGVKILRAKGLDIECVVAGSEGKQSRDLVERYSFHYIEIANQPLASKMNATLLKAKELQADYVLFMGSDDIIHNNLLRVYHDQMKQGVDFIGVTDFYFYDTVTGKAIYWGGYRESYRKGHTCGAGRVMSARLLDRLNWKCWEDNLSHHLDTAMQKKLSVLSYKEVILSLKELGVMAVDIKSSQNMTPFAKWDNTEFIDPSIILTKFPYICAE